MKKFINHVDHVAYISKWETVEANVAQLEALTDTKMERTNVSIWDASFTSTGPLVWK